MPFMRKFIDCLFFTLSIVLLCFSLEAYAAEIYLNNGDRITGKIVSESKENITVESEILDSVIIDRQFVDQIKRDVDSKAIKMAEAKPKEEKSDWKNELVIGYNQTGGNTKAQMGSAKLSMNRKTTSNEWIIKIGGDYGSSDKKLDTQKYAGLIRYAFSFGQKLKWYNFYKVEGNRDRFANINYRLVPAVGVGYWFSDKEKYKAMAEIGIGLQHTNFRDSTKTSNDTIFVPRAFLEKTLFGKLIWAQEIILYPSLSELGEYRLYSQTDLTNPISEAISLRFSFIDEFNSTPGGETKRNDFRITSSIVYAF